MKLATKTVITQAAMAAAFSAGFNSDWAKQQFVELKRSLDFGGMRPWVPYALAAGLGYYMLKGR